jgi:uncharacterized protein DUF4446
VSPTLAGVFGIAALFVAVLALVFAIQAQRALTGPAVLAEPTGPIVLSQQVEVDQVSPGPQGHPASEPELEAGPDDLRRLAKEIDTLRLELSDALQHLAMVRYDALGEGGGRLSWSMALLDASGNGVVLSAINGRNDARTYAKEIQAFTSQAKLSPEEAGVLDRLRHEASPPLGNANHE